MPSQLVLHFECVLGRFHCTHCHWTLLLLAYQNPNDINGHLVMGPEFEGVQQIATTSWHFRKNGITIELMSFFYSNPPPTHLLPAIPTRSIAPHRDPSLALSKNFSLSLGPAPLSRTRPGRENGDACRARWPACAHVHVSVGCGRAIDDLHKLG